MYRYLRVESCSVDFRGLASGVPAPTDGEVDVLDERSRS